MESLNRMTGDQNSQRNRLNATKKDAPSKKKIRPSKNDKNDLRRKVPGFFFLILSDSFRFFSDSFPILSRYFSMSSHPRTSPRLAPLPAPSSPLSASDAELENDEDTGEELVHADMMDDYRAIPELDVYDANDLDDSKEVEEMTAEQRRAAEEELNRRDAENMRRSGRRMPVALQQVECGWRCDG